MKHLFLKDDELIYMVYYTPKKKVQLFELLYNTQMKYWESDYENSDWGLLSTIIIKLRENGFKCVEITHEHHEMIDVYDFGVDSFVYRNVVVDRHKSGYTFRLYGSTYSCKTIEDVIKLIDKGW